MEDMIELLIYVLCLMLLFSMFVTIFDEEEINDFNLEEAILIDNFITYTNFGFPKYYLVYEFIEDKSIKQFSVSSEQYYLFINSPISNKAN